MATTIRTRDKRLEVRTTLEERNLINRAAEEVGTDLTSFVVTNLVDASRQVLADRDHFVLSSEAAKHWDKVHCIGNPVRPEVLALRGEHRCGHCDCYFVAVRHLRLASVAAAGALQPPDQHQCSVTASRQHPTQRPKKLSPNVLIA